MIVGYLSNTKEEMSLYPAALQSALKFLMGADVANLAVGRHDVDGSKIFALVSEYETQSKEQRRLEAHVKNLDIQYIVSGKEMIGSGPLAEVGEIIEDRLAEKDVIFFKEIAAETHVILSQGMFAVYFPWDVHRPNCSAGESACKVRKIVVKVAMDEVIP